MYIIYSLKYFHIHERTCVYAHIYKIATTKMNGLWLLRWVMRVNDNALRISLVDHKKIHCKILHVCKKKCIYPTFLTWWGRAIIHHRVTGCLCIEERKKCVSRELSTTYIVKNVENTSTFPDSLSRLIKYQVCQTLYIKRTTLRGMYILDTEDWRGFLSRVS